MYYVNKRSRVKTTSSTHTHAFLCYKNCIIFTNGMTMESRMKSNKLIISYISIAYFYSMERKLMPLSASIHSPVPSMNAFYSNFNFHTRFCCFCTFICGDTQVHKSQFNCDRTSTENGNARAFVLIQFDWLRIRECEADKRRRQRRPCRNENRRKKLRITGYLMLQHWLSVGHS